MTNHAGGVTEIANGVSRIALSSLKSRDAKYFSSSFARNNSIISLNTFFSTRELHHQTYVPWLLRRLLNNLIILMSSFSYNTQGKRGRGFLPRTNFPLLSLPK